MIKPEENEPFLNKGRDFINDSLIENLLAVNQHPDPVRIREIMAKALELNRLELDEAAVLLNCEDEELWEEMYRTGLQIKHKVYGRRIVTFAPLYVSNYCVNKCTYCGYRAENKHIHRTQLSKEELEAK